MLQGLTGWHFLIILAVILLLFGAAKLPALAKSMGQSARVFKGEMKAMKDDGSAEKPDVAASVESPSVSDVRSDVTGPAPDTKS